MVLGLAVMACSAPRLLAQQSVGRGSAMAAKAEWVGAGVPLYNMDAATAKGGAAPKGIVPLARDIFTSDDFYVDLWRDPRYFRCNSTLALDSQWGDYSSAPKYIKDDPATGAWGHCDVDYSRENIVSPYPFATARAHYEALLKETRAKRGPTQYSRERMPPSWDGRYTTNIGTVFRLVRAGNKPDLPREFSEPPQWIIGYYNQTPTILSLLTPEYQQRLVQQLYHQAHDHAPQWSATLCRPEGFMRWWSGPGGPSSLDVMVTPTRVQFLGGSSNAIRNVHVGATSTCPAPCRVSARTCRNGWAKPSASGMATHFNQTLFPVTGRATPVVPGVVLQYRVENLYGRLWAAVWEEYFEKNM